MQALWQKWLAQGHSAFAAIDLDALGHNYRLIAERVGVTVMPVVKANAYGHGLVPCARALQDAGARRLAVALPQEGIALRRAGIDLPILVMGALLPAQMAQAIDWQLELSIASNDSLHALQACLPQAGAAPVIHLKVDTGMGRLGARGHEARALIRRAQKLGGVRVQGVFSHFAGSDEADPRYTRRQLHDFLALTDGLDPAIVRHMANSAALLYHPDTYLDMVRPGLILYGAYPAEIRAQPLVLRPVMSVVAAVMHEKAMAQGEGVSYGRHWRAPRDGQRVATLRMGYGDGYLRTLGDKAQALIDGQRCPVVGRVCMDQLLIDTGRQRWPVGTPVCLLGDDGRQQIRAETLARHAGTIPYEILTQFSLRLPHLYHRSGVPCAEAESAAGS